jgi:hypothetical protein
VCGGKPAAAGKNKRLTGTKFYLQKIRLSVIGYDRRGPVSGHRVVGCAFWKQVRSVHGSALAEFGMPFAATQERPGPVNTLGSTACFTAEIWFDDRTTELGHFAQGQSERPQEG